VTLDEVIQELQSAHDEATVEFAADALAHLEVPSEKLAELTRHRYLSVRRAAVRAVARRGEAGALPLVAAKLRDAHGLLRHDAARALGRLKGAGAEPHLEFVLRNEKKAFVREAAAAALGALGGRAALDALRGHLGLERDAQVRRVLVESLGALVQEPPLALEALGTLAGQIGREQDPLVKNRAVSLLLESAKGRQKDDLVSAFRNVPTSGREALANALADRARELDPALASLTDELRGQPLDMAALSEFGTDLSARVQRGRARTYGRDREVELARARLFAEGGPRSVVLVGPSGSGKTAIVEEIARRFAAEKRVVGTVVLEVTTGDVLAGTRFLGEWQTRLKKLLGLARAPHRVVLYVPDVNQLIEAGRASDSQQNFAQMIAPWLERGEVAILGESTPEAFRRGIERDPPFRKLFQTIPVEPLSEEASLEVLRGVAGELAADAREKRSAELEVHEDALALALDHGAAYFPSLARPGNGLKLLRETVSAALAASERDVHAPLVTKTVAQLTGIPEVLINDELPLDLGAVRRFFSEHVLGQQEAVATVTDLITLIKAGLTDPQKPLGVFFFVGPTGVGKTEMAKALAEFIYGSPERIVRLDMADFKDPNAVRRLTGDAYALDPAARTGVLTAPVHERPFSVVLLDEIEKAHPNVFDLLLPLMDDGRLADDHGKVTDFRRAIVIMTSNIASDLREDVRFGFSYGKPDTREKVERIMAEHFRPEFLNRIDRTVIFEPLSLEVMRKIARREVGRVLARAGITRRKVLVDVDDSVVGLLLKEGFSERFGARPLKRRVERLVLQPLARTLVGVGRGPKVDTTDGASIVRLRARGELVSADRIGPVVDDGDDDDGKGARDRVQPRIRDPRDGTRRIGADELRARATDLSGRIGSLEEHLAGLRLRERKDALLVQSHAVAFWDDGATARNVLAEIAALEKALDAPAKLRRRLADFEDLIDRGTQVGIKDPRLLVKAAEIWDELARDVELSDYAARCGEARDRGDAFLLIRWIGDPRSDTDLVARFADMYRRWAARKGLSAVPVLELLGPDGRLRECALRVEGVCAFGLLRGEDGLHQWIDRRGVEKTDARRRDVDFLRVDVLPPSEQELRPEELRVEVRPAKKQAGKLMKRHRIHLVVTHDATMVSVEGATDRKTEDAVAEARAVLAARVQAARVPEAAPRADEDSITKSLAEGVVRRYVLSTQPVARDLASGIKAPLESVLEGELDEFIARRLMPSA
jgi:ATP-dependent Clp protease ATP-binding subunit ClpA/protein subunit release factor B